MCECVQREGWRDPSNWTAWAVDMARFIGLSLFLADNCETMPKTGPHSLGDNALNWTTFTWRHCLKLGHILLETVPQIWPHSLGDNVPNWDIFSWRHCLKFGHILLETMPQTETYSLGDSASNLATFTWRQCPKLDHSHFNKLPENRPQYLESVTQGGSQ